MFTFILQAIDVVKLNYIGLFFIFFILTWVFYGIKLVIMKTRKPLQLVDTNTKGVYAPTVSVIIPVVDEPIETWKQTLQAITEASSGYPTFGFVKKIVVVNGHNGYEQIALAEKMGFEVLRVKEASKRLAIEAGVNRIKKSDITIILDSDTVVTKEAIDKLVEVFADKTVGGATPHHVIRNREQNIIRRVCDWLEDIRFNEVVSGQSSYGAVSCLPGRLLAIRTELLKKYIPGLISQKFLGKACISGDDRYLTSELLKDGYKAVYVPESIVQTDSPNTLKGFVLQRLRWSRTSFRETLRSLSWTFVYPFTAFTVVSNVVMRWFFFIVIVAAVAEWAGLIQRPHAIDLPLWFIAVLTFIGWLASGLLRQVRHFLSYPQDLKYLPVFLFLTTFVLTPVEWFGNITLRESDWMTRDTKNYE